MAYTPFQLIQNIYDVVNLKKIYNIFPTSLRVTQLTSNQLLDLLQNRVDAQDEEIQRLLALLRESSNQQIDLSDLQSLLSGLESTVDVQIRDLLTGATQSTENTALQATISAKLAEGFRQVGNSLLFYKVDKNLTVDYDFNINHTDENGAGFRESDLDSPRSVTFENIGEETLYFVKEEKWTHNDDNISIPRFNTNAFKFALYPNLNSTPLEIQAKQVLSTNVNLQYNSKDEYDSIGLKRNGATNSWYGQMYIHTSPNSNGTFSGILQNPSRQSSLIGTMKLYRDRN